MLIRGPQFSRNAPYRFCRRKIAVPGKISVAGFDDSIEAIGNGLTSYNFNIPALVEAMFDHLYNPEIFRGAARVREIQGRMMHRLSCGPAALSGH